MAIDRSLSLLPHRTSLEHFNAYLATQVQARKKRVIVQGPPPAGPAITISRQTGTGAHEIAVRVAELLQAGEPSDSVPWTVFDRHLLDRVLNEHHLPLALAEFILEDHCSTIQSLMDDLIGVVPPPWVMVPKISETVLHLAHAGHAILVGRGASFITARVPRVFRVRLVGSLPKRTERVQARQNLTQAQAAEVIKKTDRGRARYVKSNFHVDINDAMQYHIVINTDDLPGPDVAELIVAGARRHFQ